MEKKNFSHTKNLTFLSLADRKNRQRIVNDTTVNDIRLRSVLDHPHIHSFYLFIFIIESSSASSNDTNSNSSSDINHILKYFIL